MVVLKFRNFAVELFKNNGDPIDAEMKMIKNILKCIGMRNVFGDSDRNLTPLSAISIMVFGSTFIYVGSFSQLVYLVQVFPDKLEIFKVLNCLTATSVPFSKCIFLLTSKTRLHAIFEMSRVGLASIPEGTSAHSKMLNTLQRARFASWLVVLNQAITHVLYILGPFLFTVFGNDRYLPTTPGEAYGLSPKYETPFYEIAFTITTIATAFSAVNQTGYIVLFLTVLAHELGHFYAITKTFNEIKSILTEKTEAGETVKSDAVDEKLKFCVKHHQFLIKYHRKVKDTYKVIFGAHFMMMTLVLVTTLQTMNSWDIRTTILTSVTAILPLFIYCFGGELILSAGTDMSEAVYACRWEFMEVKQSRVVLLMLCLSQKPLYLTAADIFFMNRETFGNVAQVVYKIYAVFK